MLIEVCVEDAAGLAAAVAGGADRIELCTALAFGGLTPSAGFMRQAAACRVPVFAMIRPRPGNLVFSTHDVALMLADIEAAREAGLAGVVLGASRADGRLDAAVLAPLVSQARGLGLTLHRAFDLVPDPAEALETAVALGFQRILTSGGATDVASGAHGLARTIAQAAGRIGVMPGGGVGLASVPLLRRLGVREVHGSFATAVPQPAPVTAFGFGPPLRRQTDPALIGRFRAALRD